MATPVLVEEERAHEGTEQVYSSADRSPVLPKLSPTHPFSPRSTADTAVRGDNLFGQADLRAHLGHGDFTLPVPPLQQSTFVEDEENSLPLRFDDFLPVTAVYLRRLLVPTLVTVQDFLLLEDVYAWLANIEEINTEAGQLTGVSTDALVVSESSSTVPPLPPFSSLSLLSSPPPHSLPRHLHNLLDEHVARYHESVRRNALLRGSDYAVAMLNSITPTVFAFEMDLTATADEIWTVLTSEFPATVLAHTMIATAALLQAVDEPLPSWLAPHLLARAEVAAVAHFIDLLQPTLAVHTREYGLQHGHARLRAYLQESVLTGGDHKLDEARQAVLRFVEFESRTQYNCWARLLDDATTPAEVWSLAQEAGQHLYPPTMLELLRRRIYAAVADPALHDLLDDFKDVIMALTRDTLVAAVTSSVAACVIPLPWDVLRVVHSDPNLAFLRLASSGDTFTRGAAALLRPTQPLPPPSPTHLGVTVTVQGKVVVEQLRADFVEGVCAFLTVVRNHNPTAVQHIELTLYDHSLLNLTQLFRGRHARICPSARLLLRSDPVDYKYGHPDFVAGADMAARWLGVDRARYLTV